MVGRVKYIHFLLIAEKAFISMEDVSVPFSDLTMAMSLNTNNF